MSEDLPSFPVDDMTLDMVEASLDYCLTYEDENGEPLDEPRGVGAEFSLWKLLGFLSATTTDPLGVVEDMGETETMFGRLPTTYDPRPSYHPNDVIRALIAEVRRLRSER